jgi:hypothetical protein
VHINGTLYYSLESRDQEWSFLRIVTAEDVTDPDIRKAIEDCGREYDQWLEEAELEDLPDDLELVIFFDNPRDRTPIGTFVSYPREVEFVCCPRESEDTESESESGSAPESLYDPILHTASLISSYDTRSTGVVVEIWPKQSFWLALESYPMHHTRCYRNLEVAFFTALAHSADGTM